MSNQRFIYREREQVYPYKHVFSPRHKWLPKEDLDEIEAWCEFNFGPPWSREGTGTWGMLGNEFMFRDDRHATLFKIAHC